MYNVRFHLGAGVHFMHWQVRYRDEVKYYNPDKNTLMMLNCELINVRKEAEKIYNGETKHVCAWIKCGIVRAWPTLNIDTLRPTFSAIHYNPKKYPHWVDDGEANLDYEIYHKVVTDGRKLLACK